MSLPRALAAVTLLVAILLGAIVLHDRIFPKPLLTAANDFTTFYCAGTVVRERGDPYRVEPLRACEQRLGEFSGPRDTAWEVVPAPFPGYVMALYAAMSVPPFQAAHVAWLGLLLFGVGVTALALARLTAFPLPAVLAIVAVLIGFWDLGLAEPTPIVAALLATAALCASRGAWRAAGILVALAMIMPQFALPAFLALLVYAPRSRPALLLTSAALGVVSFVTLGVATNVEYFVRTLPAQTRAEVFFMYQYSLTHLLALAGTPVSAAILIGQLSYLVLLGAGVWASARLARISGEPACLVLVPAAVASVGGAYAHSVQILSGVGAALLVASLRSVPRALAVIPLLLYCVLWAGEATWRGLLVATSVSALAALWLASGRITTVPARRRAAAVLGALVLAAAFTALSRLPVPRSQASIAAAAPPAIGPDDQASRIFQYRTEILSELDPRVEFQKVPLVLGVLLIVVCAFAARPADQVRAGAAVGASSRTIVS